MNAKIQGFNHHNQRYLPEFRRKIVLTDNKQNIVFGDLKIPELLLKTLPILNVRLSGAVYGSAELLDLTFSKTRLCKKLW